MGSISFSGTHLAIATLLICLSIASAATNLGGEYSIVRENKLEGVVSEERVLELFRRWRETHGKVYSRAGEMERRLENFKRNLKYVMQKSKDPERRHSVGLNKFADLSNEEFRLMFLKRGVKRPASKRWDERLKRKSRSEQRRRKVETCEAAASLDWRNYGIVTAVKDQGQCATFGRQ